VGIRSKEHAHDYRYFPEPDLLPLVVSEKWQAEIRASLPELPAARRRRFVEQYGIPGYDAQVLTLAPGIGDYFEEVARASGEPKLASNWVMGELAGALKAADAPVERSPVGAAALAELLRLIAAGTITGKLAKEIFPKMFASGRSAAEIIEAEGFKQISDTGELERVVDEILAANPKQVETYRGGKKGVLGFFVGQVMKATRGQANPAVVNEVLARKLG
jgi:aspartyl-tRNA(Asn)/glutamyl-tRNA(Gln) amidotransferase subunit B